MVCVAPSSRASARRCSCTSTAMIGSQPAIFAAIMPGKPDGADAEHHETVAGLRLHHVEHGAGAGLPAAGERATVASGTSLRTFTAKRSLAMVKLPNEDCWKKAL